MITVRMKKKFENRTRAIREILAMVGPESLHLFEFVGKEKSPGKDPDEIMAQELKKLGLEEK